MSTDSGMRIRTWLPWVIASLAIVALVVTLVRGGPVGTAADAEAIARLAQRLDALEQSPPQVRPAAATRERAGAGLPASGTDGEHEEARTPEQIIADRDRQLRELETRFRQDAADPATGPRTEEALVQTLSGPALAGSGLRPRHVDIACRRSSCRTVGSFDRMGEAQDWSLFYVTAAGDQLLSDTRMVFVPRSDGGTDVHIYSSRPGG